MMMPDESCLAGRKRWNAWRIVPIAVIVGGLALFLGLGFDEYLSLATLQRNRDAIVAWTEANAATAAVGFIAVYAVAVALSLPGASWLTVSGGFLFGTAAGAVYSMIGALGGAVALFLAARTAFADLFRPKVGCAMHRMEQGLREHALSYLLFLRLVPVFPFWLVNLVPALLGIPLRTFVAGTAIGIIPGTLVFAGVGNGLGAVLSRGGVPDYGIVFDPAVLAPLLGLAVLALVPVFYKKLKCRSGGNR